MSRSRAVRPCGVCAARFIDVPTRHRYGRGVKIAKVWARGYRSLRDVELDPLGDFNVFYGPNGSGKSNLIRAIQTLLRATEIWATYERPGDARLLSALSRAGVIHADDRHRRAGAPTLRTVIGLDAVAEESPLDLQLALGRIVHRHLRLELSVDWNGSAPFSASLDVAFDGVPWIQAEAEARVSEPGASARLTLARLASSLFWTVGADRVLRDERLSLGPTDATQDDPTGRDAPSTILTALREGKLQTAIFHAKNELDAEARNRFELLRALTAATLGLPPLDVGRDPRTGLIDLRQPLGAAPEHQDISMRSAGLGVEQLVAILASIVFARCDVVAVEEPEAHLHAPTTGRSLRRLLKSLVEPPEGQAKLLDQLFIATHSNLFDLDRSGYWDVRLDDGATRVARRPLHEIYAHHLYEPGPAKLLLMRALSQFGDEVVFRTHDGAQINTQDMLRRLDEDDPVALEFVRDMHAAALASLRVRARWGAGSS